jgi:formylmethanofuran dehydrogenase subunit B
MAQSSDRALRRDVVCPFCGLACDDLEIEVHESRIVLRRGACPISKAQFERVVPVDGQPRAAGAPCERAEAIEIAARILRQSRLPVIGGLATDIDGARGALELADRAGGVIDHRGSEPLFRDLTVLREIGTMTTTFSEVRNHADLLLVVGSDPLSLVPRFIERCFSDMPTLFSHGRPQRRLIRLGPGSPTSIDLPEGVSESQVACALDELPATVASLRALLLGRMAKKQIKSELVELERSLRSARYSVIAWSGSRLPSESADLIVLSLVEIVRELNRAGRSAALPLGGAENLTGVHQACLWQSGHPLRTSFGTSVPLHDPALYAAERLLESGEADALLWVSALNGGPPPALPPELPLILLAPPGEELPYEPAVFLPIGRPGIDHAGQIFRGDGVVALPLTALRSSVLPSAGITLSAITRAIESSTP